MVARTPARATAVEAAARAALATVTDPELDRSLVELGFARARAAADGHVTVELRLPTYWCAPNFVFLMAQDAREAVGGAPGVRSVDVQVVDHFAESEITDAMRAGQGFDEAFADLADGGGLEELRRIFLLKAFTRRQEQLVRRLLEAGWAAEDVTSARLGDLRFDAEPEAAEELRAYLAKRRALGLGTGAEDRFAVMPDGTPLAAGLLRSWLRRARSTRISVDSNTALCQGLYTTRYGPSEPSEEEERT
jgi:metal-sulfur cluster biosynthetic enzyme